MTSRSNQLCSLKNCGVLHDIQIKPIPSLKRKSALHRELPDLTYKNRCTNIHHVKTRLPGKPKKSLDCKLRKTKEVAGLQAMLRELCSRAIHLLSAIRARHIRWLNPRLADLTRFCEATELKLVGHGGELLA